ncbi:hypothetical protein GCM10010329_81070 [Streptomyces spiroverticillatus]|uniref:Conjugal transfer protein n=1 Tax=Streptomyces finlayi TaxID=67296 RepID=A0A918X7M2_9ACTN|nr:conjugal transfer protein [Streptomyces finlayi]GHA46289.1 hypothetical protein GCM10010329_81070 [Streptomyces spiroverticillatus]GHD16379.1 hypothetical protein GCM10010334_77430 [Streptomyces finlayi]
MAGVVGVGEQWRVFDSLDAEWALVDADAAHARTVYGLLQDSGVLSADDVAGGLAELLAELERRDRRLGPAHSDQWLYVLLDAAAGNGETARLAARVVVQAMLPGAVRLTRRLLRDGRDFDETGQVVLACLYQVVRQYPLSRQRRVAANVLLETLHLASRELAVETAVEGAVAYDADRSALRGEPSADDPVEEAFRAVLAQQAAESGLASVEEVEGARGELVELLLWAVRAGVLAAERAQVLAAETRAGAREAAERAGVSAVAWRKRCSRNVQQLRVLAGQWVQASCVQAEVGPALSHPGRCASLGRVYGGTAAVTGPRRKHGGAAQDKHRVCGGTGVGAGAPAVAGAGRAVGGGAVRTAHGRADAPARGAGRGVGAARLRPVGGAARTGAGAAGGGVARGAAVKRRRGKRGDIGRERLPVEAGGWALGSVGSAAAAVTVLRRAAWGLLLAGPALGAWALVSQPAPTVAAPAVRAERAPAAPAVGPGGFAELFVTTFLAAGEGDEALLAPFLPDARSVTLSGAVAQRVGQAAPVAVRQVSAGYWVVTVASRTRPPVSGAVKDGTKTPEETAGAALLRYFQVPVKAGPDGGLAAVSLPAEVGPPAPGEVPALAYGQPAPAGKNDPVARTLAEFFGAYLAGRGELDRYLAPGTALTPLSPAPYTQVGLGQLAEVGTNDPATAFPAGAPVADGVRRQVRAEVTATDAAGTRRPLSYAVALTARDGRWEIASVGGAPVLTPNGDAR